MGLDFSFFCDTTEKVLNYSKEHLIKLFFLICDVNQDGKVCEWDMFRLLQMIDSDDLNLLMASDIKQIMKRLNRKRNENGKDDSIMLGINQLSAVTSMAKEQRKVV